MHGKDPLSSYKEKRDFTTTPEPTGEQVSALPGWAFVVQKHAARSTHYDLRLELDGVLKSWAVPKGPSLEPGQKRLAVRVEDHPLDYLNFEGTIPAHQYGAGEVLIWDRGTWEPIGNPQQGLADGHIKFHLRGQKMQGAWVLVQMRPKGGEDNSWLLIKERDTALRPEPVELQPETSPVDSTPDIGWDLPAGARRAALPAQLAPQLATLVDKLPAGEDWLYEIKFDGYRLLARLEQGKVTLFTRSGKDWTARLASLVAPLQELQVAPGWVDGEIVMLGEQGIPDFGALQAAFEARHTGEIVYFIFDLPFFRGYDLRSTSLVGRRALLAQVLEYSPSDRLRFSADFFGKGGDILRSACEMGLEGVIGKKKESAYGSGRSASWIKLKCRQRQEFIIVGYTPTDLPGRGFKSLLLGAHDDGGRLRYAGRVGTGFNARNSAGIKASLERLTAENSSLSELPHGVMANWVLPELVAEVSFSEWTRAGLVRHAVFQGLRSDKSPGKVIREQPGDLAPPIKPQHTKGPVRPKPGRTRSGNITNPDRVIDPTTGLTKMDLVDYYRSTVPWIMSHLRRRPVSFLRAPEGLQGEFFFQKHGERMKIPGLKLIEPALSPGQTSMMYIDNQEALIGAVQMNVIEFHTWNATLNSLDKPDRMVFDLDPGAGVAWPMVLEAAELIRVLLEELELLSFLKTSGGKGLHIVVPLKPRDDWDTVKSFSKAVATHLARTIPDYFTAVSGPSNRVGKIFIDYNRNSRGATTVSAFSARARAGLGVSMPCTWQELRDIKSGDHWSIVNAGDRLGNDRDPWQGYSQTRQILKAASKRLVKFQEG